MRSFLYDVTYSVQINTEYNARALDVLISHDTTRDSVRKVVVVVIWSMECYSHYICCFIHPEPSMGRQMSLWCSLSYRQRGLWTQMKAMYPFGSLSRKRESYSWVSSLRMKMNEWRGKRDSAIAFSPRRPRYSLRRVDIGIVSSWSGTRAGSYTSTSAFLCSCYSAIVSFCSVPSSTDTVGPLGACIARYPSNSTVRIDAKEIRR
jgi:hypothetical protein